MLEKAARLTRCIVTGDYLEFPSGISLEDKIVTSDYVIDLDGNYVRLTDAGIFDVRRLNIENKSNMESLASAV